MSFSILKQIGDAQKKKAVVDVRSGDTVRVTQKIKDGNKFRLFCLNLSFIGWELLCAVPAIVALVGVLYGNFILLPLLIVSFIGSLFVDAYMEAAQAAFYREVSGTEAEANTYYVEVENEQ